VFTIIEIRGDKVRVAIEAPQSIPVHRQEVYDAIQRERAAKSANEVAQQKTLSEMTDAEFLVEGNKAVEHLTNLIQSRFKAMARLYADRPNDSSAKAIVHNGLLQVLAGLCEVCSDNEIHDEAALPWVNPIFEEALRRGEKEAEKAAS
jgi:carbon storage regulator